jgi:hypothetical protein
LSVWPHVEVELRFEGNDPEAGFGVPRSLQGALLNPPPGQGEKGGRSGNYLVVVANAYAGTAPMNQFVNAKTAEGFDVTTHSVAPGTTAAQIKSYIEGLWGGPNAPDYILLVGDTDTIPCWIGQGDREGNTDLPYACMDGPDDWYPDIAIGRFTPRSTQYLQNMVDKTLYVSAGSFSDPTYVQRAAFLAGQDAETGDEPTHNWVIDTYLEPDGFTSHKIYMRTYGADTDDIRNAVNGGCNYVMFYGHSWANQWQDGPPFSVWDVDDLTNADMYPFVVNFTCSIGDFADIHTCFTERWMRVADRGAVANIGATSLIYYQSNPGWPELSNSEKAFFELIYEEGIREISPVWQGTMYRLVELYGPDHPPCRDYMEMFNLLGDPALRIPEPPSFSVSADPESQSLCSPPADQAQYTVEVAQQGGFNTPILLYADGLPPGASAGFSVNNVPPPFTSIMTVSNIAGGSPGEYEIEIVGYTAQLQKSTFVELKLASSVPDPVTLVSPADGATGVELSPTLSWLPSAQAVEYDLEVATDSSFTNVVYSATETETNHTVGVSLDAETLHYWHVRAVNACGDSGFSAPFSFTTVERPDYFTEQFTGDFDLHYSSVSFVPDGSENHYEGCVSSISQLPVDPAGGTVLDLGEDRYEEVVLGLSKTVQLYDYSYTSFYVCSNGYITFGSGDTDWEESLADHFDMPRISPLFDDLSPPGGGTISWQQLADRAVVTYEGVPEYQTGNSNTFQVELFFDGKIRISWLEVDSSDSVVGLSEGNGIPGDYTASDLSADYEWCCPGDLNGDGQVGLADLARLLMHYGTTSGAEYEDGDLDEDGDVDLADLTALLTVYGTVCP